MSAYEDGVRAVAEALEAANGPSGLPYPASLRGPARAALAASLRWAVVKILAGPEVPLPPSLYATLLTEYADEIEAGQSDG